MGFVAGGDLASFGFRDFPRVSYSLMHVSNWNQAHIHTLTHTHTRTHARMHATYTMARCFYFCFCFSSECAAWLRAGPCCIAGERLESNTVRIVRTVLPLRPACAQTRGHSCSSRVGIILYYYVVSQLCAVN
jgi:hypothetical protein